MNEKKSTERTNLPNQFVYLRLKNKLFRFSKKLGNLGSRIHSTVCGKLLHTICKEMTRGKIKWGFHSTSNCKAVFSKISMI